MVVWGFLCVTYSQMQQYILLPDVIYVCHLLKVAYVNLHLVTVSIVLIGLLLFSQVDVSPAVVH